MTIFEINNPAKLETLAGDWTRLLAVTPGADFFRTLSWLQVYWKHFGQQQRLRVLAAFDGDDCIGILPLVVRPQRFWMGTFRVLGFPLCWGSFYGCVGPSARRVLEEAFAHIAATRRDWDYIDLRWLKSTEDATAWVLDALRSCDMQPCEKSDFEIPIADLSTGWDIYWASRSANWRSNCRRNENKLAKNGAIEYLRYRPLGKSQGDADPRWDLYEMVLLVAEKSWQGRSKDGTTMSHDSVCEYLRDLHSAAVDEGNLDLNLLMIDDRPAAFNYNYHYRGHVSSLRLGFDPEYSHLGVGTVLTKRMLEDSCRRGDHTFDFLPGSHMVKRPWQTSLENSVWYEYIPSHLGRIELLRAQNWLGERWPGSIWRALRSRANTIRGRN